MDRILRTTEDVDEFVRLLCGLKLPLTVAWKAGADRTGQQNRLMWLWANEAAQQLGDRHAEDVQAEWKLTIGVPALRADDADFRAVYDKAIRPLPYEHKVAAMKMGFPVTSIMKVRQMVHFMDAVQQKCLELGLRLTEPDPELAKYQARYRANGKAVERSDEL